MATGTVKWFDQKKGFGFIINADGKDVFVHYSCIEGDGFRALKDGWTVEYEEIKGDKGLSAKTVHRVGSDLDVSVPVPAPGQLRRKAVAVANTPPLVASREVYGDSRAVH